VRDDPVTDPAFCHRCGAQLTRGDGSLYFVRIEAFADPEVILPEAPDDSRAEMERLMEEASRRSEAELMDEVYRRLTITLCARCYHQWIENPAGA
jgi:hypothetical protein